MREQKKVRLGISALLIAAIILFAIGMIYLPLGILLRSIPDDGKALMITFASVGAALLSAALVLVLIYLRRRARIQAAYEYGECYECVIGDIVTDASVRLNHRSMRYAQAVRTDPVSGAMHVYRSRRMSFCPEELIGRTVRVYVDRGNERIYYVDIDEILPEIVYH